MRIKSWKSKKVTNMENLKQKYLLKENKAVSTTNEIKKNNTKVYKYCSGSEICAVCIEIYSLVPVSHESYVSLLINNWCHHKLKYSSPCREFINIFKIHYENKEIYHCPSSNTFVCYSS